MKPSTGPISPSPARDPEFFAAYKIAELARFAADLPAAPEQILDFGSGIGNSLPFFRERFPNAALTCADASSRSMALSRQRFPGPERYALVEGREIPLDERRLRRDVLGLRFPSHPAPGEHGHWLRELLRVTRPGGLLAIFEHNPLQPPDSAGREHMSLRRERQARSSHDPAPLARGRGMGGARGALSHLFSSRPRRAPPAREAPRLVAARGPVLGESAETLRRGGVQLLRFSPTRASASSTRRFA